MPAELALTHDTDYRDIGDATFLRRVLDADLEVILGASKPVKMTRLMFVLATGR